MRKRGAIGILATTMTLVGCERSPNAGAPSTPPNAPPAQTAAPTTPDAPSTAQAPAPDAPPSAEVEQASTLEIAADGFPTGRSTPEGVACDFARAYLNCDSALFKECVVPKCGDPEAQAALDEFVGAMTEQIDMVKEMAPDRRGGPKAFKECYAARHMTKSGPASFAYAALRYDDLMFVDVVVTMWNEPDYLCRTLVLKGEDGTWYVHPDPSSAPLLEEGLNDESDSTVTFREAYGVRG